MAGVAPLWISWAVAVCSATVIELKSHTRAKAISCMKYTDTHGVAMDDVDCNKEQCIISSSPEIH